MFFTFNFSKESMCLEIKAPLVVIFISFKFLLKFNFSKNVINSLRTNGSPPVSLTLFTPNSLNTRIIRYISL